MRRGLGDLRWSLLAAAVLHLAALGWFTHRPVPAVDLADAPLVTPLESTIDVEAEVPLNAGAVASTTAGARTTSAPRTSSPAARAPAAPVAEPGTEPVAVERPTDWVVHPTGTIDLAVPRSAFAQGGVFEAPSGGGKPADPSAPVGRSTTGGLLEGLDLHDIEVGLGRSGPVRAAVDAAAHDPAAPVLGTATFAVSVLAGGKIHVDLVDASSERNGWEKLNPIITRGLADKAMRIPSTARGIRVMIKVKASEQFPGGAAPLPENKQGVSGSASIGKIVETKDQIVIVPPHAELGYHGRKCGVDVAVTVGSVSMAGGCEIGVAMRVVETELIREERL